MKHTLAEIFEIVTAAGLEDAGGFPLRATMAAIAFAESGGDPDAFVEHDPPTSLTAAPSSGMYQVNRRWWAEIFAATERVRLNPALSDAEKMIRQTQLVRPIMADALRAASNAARTLQSRNVYVDVLNTALFVNATWQAGADNVAAWSRTTRTGDPREIVNPKRSVDVEVDIRKLAGSAVGASSAFVTALGLLAAFGFVGAILSRWRI